MPLLFALALRAAIPAGFMLAPDATGHLSLVLCSGMGPIAHAHHHHHDGAGVSQTGNPDGSARETDSLCPFAGSAGAALLPTIAAAPPTVCAHIVVAAVESASFAVSTIFRVQQARGPPWAA